MPTDKPNTLNSICTCGHPITDHRPSIFTHSPLIPVNVGHGSCRLCYCSQFTWSNFLVEKGGPHD